MSQPADTLCRRDSCSIRRANPLDAPAESRIDAPERIEAGERVTLDDYLDEHPDLLGDDVAIDAAISSHLRSAVAMGTALEEAVEWLIARHPDLEGEIHRAVVLDELVDSEIDGGTLDELSLPFSIGPMMADGRPRYEMRRVISRGGNATVFEGVDRLLTDHDGEATVAIKASVFGHLADMAPTDLRREATRARRVEHANIARVMDVGFCDDPPFGFIVTELVTGGTLEAWIDSRTPVADRLVVLSQVAAGLEAIHRAWLVHCDLKPSNILLRSDGSVAIADFGLTLHRDRLDDASVGLRGTIAYCAPEQFGGHEEQRFPVSIAMRLERSHGMLSRVGSRTATRWTRLLEATRNPRTSLHGARN